MLTADRCLSDHFEATAISQPDAVALSTDTESITYRQLLAQVGVAVRSLEARGVAPSDRIALIASRHPRFMATLLALLRIGAHIVPLDPRAPAKRLRALLSATSPSLVISDQERLPSHAVVPIDALLGDDVLSPTSSSKPDPSSKGSSAKVVFFTSGTAHIPAPVLVSQAAILSRLTWMSAAYPFLHSDMGIAHRSAGVMGAMWDYFGPLLAGAPLALFSPAVQESFDAFFTFLTHARVTYMTATPSVWTVILDHAERHTQAVRPPIRIGISAGEVLPTSLLARWRSVFPAATLLNVYGCTECQTPLLFDTTNWTPTGVYVPAGFSACGASTLLLDESDKAVAPGQIGRLLVAGPGLADGYITNEAHHENFSTLADSPGRVFRTGDRARLNTDGQYEIAGRVDDVINVHGFRVDPAEIESHILEDTRITQAAVTVNANGGAPLIAWLALCKGTSLTDDLIRDTRQRLKSTLPAHMVPATLLSIDAFPLAKSGKLDRAALRTLLAADEACPTRPPDSLEAMWTSLHREDLTPINDWDRSFEENGGDSLSAMRLCAALNDRFAVRLTATELLSDIPIRALLERVLIDRKFTTS